MPDHTPDRVLPIFTCRCYVGWVHSLAGDGGEGGRSSKEKDVGERQKFKREILDVGVIEGVGVTPGGE